MVHTLQTILEDLLSASNVNGFVFDDGRNEPVTVPFTVLSKEVSQLGRQMLHRGIKPNERVAIILEDNREFVTAFLGAVIEGVIPVPIYPPPKIGNQIQHLENACRIMLTGRVDHLICSAKTRESLSHLDVFQHSKMRTHTFSSITEAEMSKVTRIRVRPEDTCFLQFTSGSTSSPKGVVISHENILENTRAIVEDGLKAKPETDLGVSWLPLYHDMGLIGFVIAPVVGRIPVVLAPTFSFIRRPSLWMKLVDKYKATITFGPNFAFSLSRKRAQRVVDQGIRLDHLRVLGCGAEPINAQNMRDFISAFRPAGLNPRAITPSYGMAEACLAVAFEPLDEEIYSIYVDRHCLSEGDQIKLVDAKNSNAE
ncbi:MAG: AMP-binding protein [Myxococcota bacterium]|nr:AMP-binding protein [Myxococcota bacterium]